MTIYRTLRILAKVGIRNQCLSMKCAYIGVRDLLRYIFENIFIFTPHVSLSPLIGNTHFKLSITLHFCKVKGVHALRINVFATQVFLNCNPDHC